MVVVLVLGAAARAGYVTQMTAPVPADPWRHMLLIDNVRSGAGFTLFDGQPYLWYSPVWYHIAAVAPGRCAPWVSAVFSFATVPLFLIYL